MGSKYLKALRDKPLREYDEPERFNVVLPRDLRIPVDHLVKYWNAEEHVLGDGRPRINRSHVIRAALKVMLEAPAVCAYLSEARNGPVSESDRDAEAEAVLAAHLGLPLRKRRRRRR